MVSETGEKIHKTLTMAEIAKLKGVLNVNQSMLIVPSTVVETASQLQHDLKTATGYLENCYLVYRDCTLNHVASGIALQLQDGAYQWLTPGDFSWGNVEKVFELGDQVKVREEEKFAQQVGDSVSVHDTSGRLLYYQRQPQLDRTINFIVPSRLAFADAMDWTRTTSQSLYRPALKIKDFLEGDELLENQGRIFLNKVLENLRQPTPC